MPAPSISTPLGPRPEAAAPSPPCCVAAPQQKQANKHIPASSAVQYLVMYCGIWSHDDPSYRAVAAATRQGTSRNAAAAPARLLEEGHTPRHAWHAHVQCHAVQPAAVDTLQTLMTIRLHDLNCRLMLRGVVLFAAHSTVMHQALLLP